MEDENNNRTVNYPAFKSKIITIIIIIVLVVLTVLAAHNAKTATISEVHPVC